MRVEYADVTDKGRAFVANPVKVDHEVVKVELEAILQFKVAEQVTEAHRVSVRRAVDPVRTNPLFVESVEAVGETR